MCCAIVTVFFKQCFTFCRTRIKNCAKIMINLNYYRIKKCFVLNPRFTARHRGSIASLDRFDVARVKDGLAQFVKHVRADIAPFLDDGLPSFPGEFAKADEASYAQTTNQDDKNASDVGQAQLTCSRTSAAFILMNFQSNFSICKS